jgi:hypothetical protein
MCFAPVAGRLPDEPARALRDRVRRSSRSLTRSCRRCSMPLRALTEARRDTAAANLAKAARRIARPAN